MNTRRSPIFTCLLILIISSLIMTPTISLANASQGSVKDSRPDINRNGAWLDSIKFSKQDTPAEAVAQLTSDRLDVYTSATGGYIDPALAQSIISDPDITYTFIESTSNDLTFNPYGPLFNDGRLNPFSNNKIREAMNWLVDRDYIVHDILSDLAVPKLLSIQSDLIEYNRYQVKCQELEARYPYDFNQAQTVITDEMLTMGATLEDGTWYYTGQPITLIFIIRSEDARTQIGDYVADQLENVGFLVDRQYMTGSQASPIWNQGDPAEGLFHIYTGGWYSTSIIRDEGFLFSFYYTPNGMGGSRLWMAYKPSPEFNQVASDLRGLNYQTMIEREKLFNQALEYSLTDTGTGSVRIWLVNYSSLEPRRYDTDISYDLVGGISGSDLWPFITRFHGIEGGDLRVAQPDILVDPWNPISGSNWLYDSMPQKATYDSALLIDPFTGLSMPQRAVQADLIVQEGLLVTTTLDWVNLSFVPEITVPGDAWVDWDAVNQVFITAAEKFTETLTAKIKSVIYYPDDMMSTVTWHDGSPLSSSDFVMNMIMKFDPAKPESTIYNEELAPSLEDFLSSFKGVRIISTAPLIIETYSDFYTLDGENCISTWWPNYLSGPAAWHNLTLGVRADADHLLAFTSGKANQLGVEWMDFKDGESLGILKIFLDLSQIEGYIPYLPTLGAYISTNEANLRWGNLQVWYAQHSHFWLGTGPFYLEYVDASNGTISLKRNLDFPDPADKWDVYTESRPLLTINYPDGSPGSFFNITGRGFPGSQTATISINGTVVGSAETNNNGIFTFTLDTTGIEEGIYVVLVSVNPQSSVIVRLNNTAPVREPEGDYPIIQVPPGIAFSAELFLPMLSR